MSNGNDPWATIPGGYDDSRPGGPGDDFSDLDSFGAEYRPEAAFPLDIDTLVNGDYDFEVLKADLKHAQGTPDRICELTLQVLGGRRVRWTWWLNKQTSVNKACADLAALGFDAHLWNTLGRPLSKEIPAAIARLAGMKFRALKTSRKDNRPGVNREYHDLAISCRLDGRPMPTAPATGPNGARPPSSVPTPSAGSAGPSPGGQADDNLPF